MDKEDKLHALIHSLSQNEKRYFKMLALRQSRSGEQNYLRLFEAILKQKTYDEREIKRIFEGEKLATRLHSERNYLYRLILKSLRYFQEEKDPIAKLQNGLREIEILRERGHPMEAWKMLRRLKKPAEELEQYSLLVEIHYLERKFLQAYAVKATPALLRENFEAKQKAQQLREQLETLQDIHNQLIFELRSDSSKKLKGSALDKLETHPLVAAQNPPKGVNAGIFYFRIHAYLAKVKLDRNQCYLWYKKLVSLWESNPFIRETQGFSYLTDLANCLSFCHAAQDYDSYPHYLHLLSVASTHTQRERIEKESNLLYYKLLFRMNHAEFGQATELAAPILELLQNHSPDIPMSRQIAFRTNLAILHFMCKDWNDSLAQVNAVLDQEGIEHRQDLIHLCLVLSMVLQYERGKYDLLESIYRSVYRKLKRRGRDSEFESVVLRTLRRIPGCPNRAAENQLLQELLEFLDPGRHQPPPPGFQELRLWVRSRLEGRSPSDIWSNDLAGNP